MTNECIFTRVLPQTHLEGMIDVPEQPSLALNLVKNKSMCFHLLAPRSPGHFFQDDVIGCGESEARDNRWEELNQIHPSDMPNASSFLA